MSRFTNDKTNRAGHARNTDNIDAAAQKTLEDRLEAINQPNARRERLRQATDTSDIDFDPNFGAEGKLDLEAIETGAMPQDTVRYKTRQAARQAEGRRAQAAANAQNAAQSGASGPLTPDNVTHTVDRHGNHVRIVTDPDGTQHRYVRKKKSSHKHKRRKLIIRIVVAVIAVILIATIAIAALFASSAMGIMNNVSGLTSEAKSLVTSLQKGDAATYNTASSELTSDVNEIYETTSSIPWKIASHAPFIGDDIMAARKIVHLAYDACNDVLPEVTDAVNESNGQPLVSSDLTYNVAVCKALCNSLADNCEALQFHADQFSTSGTYMFDQVYSLYTPIAEAVETINNIAHLDDGEGFHSLAGILGCYDDRFYLVVAQTNSECRATAGFMGSYIPVTVSNGKIDIGDSHSLGTADGVGEDTWGLNPFDNYPEKFTSEEMYLFNSHLGDSMGGHRTIGDLNFNPDFSRVGLQYSQAWDDQAMGEEIDGIISLDPVMLQNIMELAATSITLDDGEVLKVSDISEEILHTVYMDNSKNADQDARFSDIAKACIPVLAGKASSLDYTKLIKTLKEGCSDSRFMMWMDAGYEQHLVHELGASHSFEIDECSSSTGVFLNNITWGKSDWYLSCDSKITNSTKNSDGSISYRISVTMENHLTSLAEAESLNRTITGPLPENHEWTHKRSLDDIVTGVYLYAPLDGTIGDVTMSGNAFELEEGTYEGCDVLFGLSQLQAQETLTIEYTVTVAAEYASTPLTIRQTPLCNNY